MSVETGKPRWHPDTNMKAKGPASVAPDPDRGSTNPAEDRMNTHSNTTLAPAASKDFI